MKHRIADMKNRISLLIAFFAIGITTSIAQTDSATVVTSADSTIVHAEEQEKIVVPPVLNADEQAIAQRLKVLQKDVPLVYNKRIKGFIDYFTVRNPRYAMVMERRKRIYFPTFEEILKNQK